VICTGGVDEKITVLSVLLSPPFSSFLLLPEYWDLMNTDEKSDVIPEVWEGHDIADYIDPDIMKVCSSTGPPRGTTPFNAILGPYIFCRVPPG